MLWLRTAEIGAGRLQWGNLDRQILAGGPIVGEERILARLDHRRCLTWHVSGPCKPSFRFRVLSLSIALQILRGRFMSSFVVCVLLLVKLGKLPVRCNGALQEYIVEMVCPCDATA
jgi:hypothetical protein